MAVTESYETVTDKRTKLRLQSLENKYADFCEIDELNNQKAERNCMENEPKRGKFMNYFSLLKDLRVSRAVDR